MTPWTAAYQAPLSMGFSRQEYWSGVPSPSLKGVIEDLKIKKVKKEEKEKKECKNSIYLGLSVVLWAVWCQFIFR